MAAAPLHPVALWYALCAVGGLSASLLSPFIVALGVVGALVIFGVMLANSSERPEGLEVHHAVIGLALALALDRIGPIAGHILGARF